MKKIILALILTILLISMSSCEKQIIKNQESDYQISTQNDEHIPDITNGKYYFTQGNGYIEITDKKFFQIVDMDEEYINEITSSYSKSGYLNQVYIHDRENPVAYTEQECNEIKMICNNSTEINDEIIADKAAFDINYVPNMEIFDGTNYELRVFLDDYKLWFPFLYYENEKKMILNIDLKYEFVLKK